MAVILFKKGNTHKERGIPCQMQICNEYSYLHLLKQGWHYTPEECYAEEEPELVEIPEVKEETETEEEPIDEIRVLARDAGISHWHNKSINRLTKELRELEDAEQPED
jgi:hypothetical protein